MSNQSLNSKFSDLAEFHTLHSVSINVGRHSTGQVHLAMHIFCKYIAHQPFADAQLEGIEHGRVIEDERICLAKRDYGIGRLTLATRSYKVRKNSAWLDTDRKLAYRLWRHP